MSNSIHKSEPASLAEAMDLGARRFDFSWLYQFIKHNRLSILVLVVCGVVLSLPYQFRPGGKAEVQAIDKQKVQAQLAGRIKEIMPIVNTQKGIPAGTVIAKLDTPELKAELSKLKEEITVQQAKQRSAKAELNQLLNTPRPEEVKVAAADVEIAKEELRVAETQLVALKSRATYSASEASRLQILYEQGAISLQDSENARRQADIEADNVKSQLGNISTRRSEVEAAKTKQTVVLSGPHPEQVQSAREQVAAAQASIQVLEQQKLYVLDQIRRADVKMPFDGLLTTSDLENKSGTYLNQGDTLSEAEVIRGDATFVRVQIPEMVVDQLVRDSTVEIKLLAYPNNPFFGRVVSIQPSAKAKEVVERQAERSGDVSIERESKAGRVVEVMVEVHGADSRLTPGMTGYAKIDGEKMPVIVAFTRALVRFVKIEIWSWLP
jgi:putative peptide zinc metalloprotease protein